MRLGPDRVGLRGWMLVGATGIVGIALAVHGYGRGAVLAAGRSGLAIPDAAAPTTVPPTTAKAPPSTTVPGPSRTTVTPTNSSSTTNPPVQKLGPLLSSTQYAQFAYQLYPGPQSTRTRQATAGFTIHVSPRANTISLSIAASGSGQGPQTTSYPKGDKVYFVEETFGDDSGASDYSFGDDGVIVTNAQGYLVQ